MFNEQAQESRHQRASLFRATSKDLDQMRDLANANAGAGAGAGAEGGQIL